MSKYNTVAEALKYYGDQCGEDTPFFVFRGSDGSRVVFTYGDLHRLAGRCAAYLRHRGIHKGSLVMVCLPNSPERLVCEFGLLYAGAVSVNGLCLRTDGADLLHSLRHSQANAILLDPDVTHSPWKPLQNVVQRADDGSVTSEKLPCLERVEFIRRHPEKGFLGYLDQLTEWFMEDEVQRDDPCFVFTTSGTTGFSKLAVHPHHNFVSLMEKWTRGVEPSKVPRSVRYQDTPLGTSGGNVATALMLNETRVMCDERAGLPEDRAAFISRCIQEEKCTKASLSPADIAAIHHRLKRAKKSGLNACDNNHNNDPLHDGCLKWDGPLEQVSIGGQPVTRMAVDAALALSRMVMVYYGATELGLIAVGMVAERSSYEDYNVGGPLPGVQVKVVDERTDAPLPPGQVGQLLIKHPIPFLKYLHDPDDPTTPRPAASFTTDGFYRTGDRGRVNHDHSLTVFGRTGDSVITRGPAILYPHVIEAAVSACPGVADVIVVGVPDPVMTEEFCACVVLEEGGALEEVKEEVEKRFVGPGVTRASLVPRYYVPFPSLPQLYTGRPDRRLIKDMATKQLAAQLTD